MTENKIYVGWINSKNFNEVWRSNFEYRKELKTKYKILCCDKQPNKEELENNDVVYILLGGNRFRIDYQVLKRPNDLTNDEIALIIDGDLLYFGYATDTNNIFYIYKD